MENLSYPEHDETIIKIFNGQTPHSQLDQESPSRWKPYHFYKNGKEETPHSRLDQKSPSRWKLYHFYKKRKEQTPHSWLDQKSPSK